MTARLKMKAAVLFEVNKPLEIVDDIEIDAPRVGEALVRITHSGVCHSDLGVIENPPGAYKPPFVMGHEASGVIEQLVGGNGTFVEGDRVVLSMRAPCDECFYCSSGQPVLCKESHLPPGSGEIRLWRKGKPVQRGMNLGAFAEYAVVPLRGLTKVPADVKMQHAAVCGCAIQTAMGSVLNIAKSDHATRACVIGLGGIGQAMIMALRYCGAQQIVGIDPVQERRQIAREMGADLTYSPSDPDLMTTLMSLTEGVGFDTVFDNVGTTQTSRDGLAMARAGGELVLIGVAKEPQTLGITVTDLILQQKRVTGAFLGNCHPEKDMPKILEAVRSGALPMEKFVTETMPLERINDALDLMRNGQGIRTVLTF